MMPLECANATASATLHEDIKILLSRSFSNDAAPLISFDDLHGIEQHAIFTDAQFHDRHNVGVIEVRCVI